MKAFDLGTHISDITKVQACKPVQFLFLLNWVSAPATQSTQNQACHKSQALPVLDWQSVWDD